VGQLLLYPSLLAFCACWKLQTVPYCIRKEKKELLVGKAKHEIVESLKENPCRPTEVTLYDGDLWHFLLISLNIL
jgi:hypothetical protein